MTAARVIADNMVWIQRRLAKLFLPTECETMHVRPPSKSDSTDLVFSFQAFSVLCSHTYKKKKKQLLYVLNWNHQLVRFINLSLVRVTNASCLGYHLLILIGLSFQSHCNLNCGRRSRGKLLRKLFITASTQGSRRGRGCYGYSSRPFFFPWVYFLGLQRTGKCGMRRGTVTTNACLPSPDILALPLQNGLRGPWHHKTPPRWIICIQICFFP